MSTRRCRTGALDELGARAGHGVDGQHERVGIALANARERGNGKETGLTRGLVADD